MTDYGQPITFGLSLYPSVELLDETRQLAQAADAAGLDYLAIQDHAYNVEFLDVWTRTLPSESEPLASAELCLQPERGWGSETRRVIRSLLTAPAVPSGHP